MNERRIEREFGVAVPGEIVAETQWTRTALKKLPAEGPLDWNAIFGRQAPVVLDIGCGNGRFLIGSAFWRRDLDHLGIDILPLALRYATRRANQRGLANIRFAAVDGLKLVECYLAPNSIAEIHCYHPQPYYHPAEAERRLMTPRFIALVHRALNRSGKFFVQTDNEPYWAYIRQILPGFFEVHDQERTWPDAPKGRTRREIIALKRGYKVFRGWCSRRDEIGAEEAATLAESLPLPTFDAGRPPTELDEMEKQ